ncbi:hypothetical protein BFN03_03955 [Rhodococcus sp. WMMA185]|uniref:hypothetical protein n=1 Tax=Rhodococcus sp. WMMA185 TaxID=679318 RepID=UPI000877EC20|nr:hypothetical protein [Rhodococcus sp. WMMA185]AOW92142.1 hypothetical protein BFN03_03955 [Rhodococcus sp. WMMA185]
MKKSVRTAAIAFAVSPLLGLAVAAPASAEPTANPVPVEDLIAGSMEFGELVADVMNGGVDFGSLGTGSTEDSTGSVGSIGDSLGSTDDGTGDADDDSDDGSASDSSGSADDSGSSTGTGSLSSEN